MIFSLNFIFPEKFYFYLRGFFSKQAPSIKQLFLFSFLIFIVTILFWKISNHSSWILRLYRNRTRTLKCRKEAKDSILVLIPIFSYLLSDIYSSYLMWNILLFNCNTEILVIEWIIILIQLFLCKYCQQIFMIFCLTEKRES